MQIWHYQFLNIAWFGHFLKYLQWWRCAFFEAILDSCLYFHSRLNLLRGLLFPIWSFNGWNSLFGDYKVPILGIWSLWQDILLLVNLLYFDGTRVRVKINCLSGSWIHIETILLLISTKYMTSGHHRVNVLIRISKYRPFLFILNDFNLFS